MDKVTSANLSEKVPDRPVSQISPSQNFPRFLNRASNPIIPPIRLSVGAILVGISRAKKYLDMHLQTDLALLDGIKMDASNRYISGIYSIVIDGAILVA